MLHGYRYSGLNLLQAVDGLDPPPRQTARPLRLVIAETMKTRSLGHAAFSGKLDSGAIRTGFKVCSLSKLEVCYWKLFALKLT